MNVERVGKLLPVTSERWLAPIVADAFGIERRVPDELERMLLRLQRPLSNR